MSAPTLDFESVTIPDAVPDFGNFDAASEGSSTDPTCEGCGAALSYSGRGRKPKWCEDCKPKRTSTSGGSRRASGDVETAVQSLHTLYDTLCYPLSAVSPAAAQAWSAQIDDLDNRNRMFLSTNKDLVKKINGAASKGGTSAFVLSHVIAVMPVAMVLRMDFAARAAQRAAQREAEMGDHFSDVPPTDPDAAFRMGATG